MAIAIKTALVREFYALVSLYRVRALQPISSILITEGPART